jgi:hypothetical protein
MRTRTLYTVGLIAIALVAVGVFAVSGRHSGAPKPGAKLSDSDTASGVPGRESPPAARTTEGVVDTPRPPSGLADKVLASGLSSLTTKEQAAWNAYLAETKKVVLDNQATLRSTLDAAVSAIVSGDAAKLGTLFAPDEPVDEAYLRKLATVYPKISESNTQSSVGVFTLANCTVYYGYSVVRWTDAAIVSEQTIAVPLRFISGTWYLTGIGSGTEGLKAVQSVRM